MNIILGYGDLPGTVSGSSDYRIHIPFEGINTYTVHRAEEYSLNYDLQKIIERSEWADAFIIERNLFGDVFNVVKWLKERYPSKAFITTFDDGYHHVTRDVPIYDFWVDRHVKDLEGKTVTLEYDPLKQFLECLPYFDEAFVANRKLVEDYSPYTKTIYVPSYQRTAPFLRAKRVRTDDEILIGWGAGESHHRSISRSAVLEALRRIMREYPHVHFFLRAGKRIQEETKIKLEGLMDRVVMREKAFVGDDWPQHLVNLDIGLAVLSSHSKFDARRSWLKISEYMLTKVPFVAAKSPTYMDYYDYGLFAETEEEWYQALKTIVEDRQAYKERYLDKAFKFACSMDIKHHVDQDYIGRIEAILNAKGWDWREHRDLNAPVPVQNDLVLPAKEAVQYLLKRGSQHFEGGEYQAAIADFNQVIGIAPGISAAHSMLSLAYFALGRLALAEEEANKAIELAPNDPQPKSTLKMVLAARKKSMDKFL
jgi:tetratricopeptide (TPR) repeat protein